MSINEEGLSLVEGGALIVERVVPKPGTFTLIMSDTMCFEDHISLSRTLNIDPTSFGEPIGPGLRVALPPRDDF